MQLYDFFNFNRYCPVCEEPLHVYLKWDHGALFKGKTIKQNFVRFEPYKLYKRFNFESNLDYIDVSCTPSSFDAVLSSSKIGSEAKKHLMFFFFLCNPDSFKDKGDWDYELNMYKACYFRRSQTLEFKKEENQKKKRWYLDFSDKSQIKINSDEHFVFKSFSEDVEKLYFLSLDAEQDKTILQHYIINAEHREQSYFNPKIFKKELPYLENRPNFDLRNREKLIDKFENWILMS
jgi:hypothetical protein